MQLQQYQQQTTEGTIFIIIISIVGRERVVHSGAKQTIPINAQINCAVFVKMIVIFLSANRIYLRDCLYWQRYDISCCDPDYIHTYDTYIKQNKTKHKMRWYWWKRKTKKQKYELNYKWNRLKIQFVQTRFFNQTVYLKTKLYNSAILMKFTEII